MLHLEDHNNMEQRLSQRLSLNLNNRFSKNLDILLDAYEKSNFTSGKMKKFKELNKESPEEEEKTTAPEKEEVPNISFFRLFRYSTGLDKTLIFFALVFSLVSAGAMTVLSLAFGDATGVIVTYAYTAQINGTDPEVMEEASRVLEDGMIWFVAATTTLGAIILVSTYFSTVMLNYSALRQTFKIRELFFSKVLNQDISWYDQNQTGDFSSRMADDLKKIEEGMGEKIGIVVFYEGVFVASLIQGLVIGWELALICMISFPVTGITMGAVALISSKLAKQETEAYGAAGAVAEETLSSIRTVVAFGGQEKEEARYNNLLMAARNNNTKRSFFNGLSQGLMWLFAYASYSLAFWYGVKLILADRGKPENEVNYEAGKMITIFFSVLTGSWYFGMAAPFIEAFGVAQGAAAKIFHVIASQPIINKSKGTGKKPRRISGKITFKNVHFTYPSRKDVKVLNGLNLTINSGETVALVGSSGCGKSTCIQLLQRFYDPDSGTIYIDNNKMGDWDLNWLRSYVGVVGQEPVLFETTIAENIRYGYLDANQEEIEEAAKKANAHTFITALPQGYSTMIGERGAQLSGGQKQRIAIARALVREPAILLLDEATSALDTKSEAVVQAALDAASHGCTTVIVAHRLSTVRQADRIIVISEGQVKEEGSHEALMAAKGAYHQLVTAQVTEPDDIDDDGTHPIDAIARNELLQRKSIDETDAKRPSLLPSTVSDFVKAPESSASSSSLWAIMKYNSPEWWIIVLGCLSSMVTGCAMPVFSILFGDIIGILGDVDDDAVRTGANKFSLFFLVIGIISGVATLIQCYTFGVSGERLTMRLRSLMYKAMLRQEIGWFDVKDNGVGALCARLSSEAASLQGATGQRIGTILNSATTIIIALTIAFYYEWRLTFVALCFSPLIVIFVYLEQKIIAKESESQYKSLQNSTKTAVEAINGIRTVASLGCEQVFHDLYMNELMPYQNTAKRNTHVRGVVYGVSRSLMCFAYAASLYYGSQLVRKEGLAYGTVFIVTEILITSSWSLANALAFTPNFSKGLIAAHRIFDLINRTPEVVDGSQNTKEKWETGNIDYKKIHFSYPNRPAAKVLRGLDLSVLQGKMVALVGPSGCGKSTIVQLLERFYDPTSGEITADDRGIERMNLLALRSHLGIVSQEPNLFSKTIAENIAYGDNTRTVTKDEVIRAAKQANIHTFITSLPLGYETKLGEKGTQLSGGQKQRVAIARALVRNPKVLLLDEATSALDAESEKVVQEALDNAKVGRTCISIAHRLTTIQDADVICVINHGRVCEIGTHSELLNKRGLYHSLYSLQYHQ